MGEVADEDKDAKAFDDEFAAGDPADDAAAFDAEFEPVAAPAKGAGVPQVSASKSEPSGLDYLLSLADGMSFGHGKWAEDLLGGSPTKLRHPEATMVNPGMMANIPQTPGTKLAKAAGTALEAIPLSIAAGPGIGAQALMGAGVGGASAHGNDEDVLGGMMLGGALGAAGGAVGKGLQALREPAKTSAQMALPGLGGKVPTVADDALRKLADAKPDLFKSITSPWEAAKNAGGRAALTAGLKTPPGAARAVGGAASGVGGSWFGDEAGRVVGAAAAQAQDTGWNVETGDAELAQNGVRAVIGEPVIDEPWQVQTGDAQIRDNSPAATQSWAVESVLYQGNTGLPREAEQQLTEAALSGDPEKLATATFLLSGRYPQFSDALQKQRSSLIREED